MKSFNTSSLLLALCLTAFASFSYAATEGASATETPAASSLESLLQQVKQFKNNEQSANNKKEAEFSADVAQQTQRLAQAKKDLAQAQKRADQLKASFDKNEKKLSAKETELNENVGNLGELFGVVRQVAEELQTELNTSLTTIDHLPAPVDLDKLAASKELPQVKELEGLWFALQQQMTLSGQIKKLTAPVVGLDGQQSDQQVVRIGVFNALLAGDDAGYLRFDSETGQLLEMSRQPAQHSLVSDFIAGDSAQSLIAIDPTRGALLDLVISNPDVLGRVQQGSYVGYAIIIIGLIGVALALWRLQVLLLLNKKMQLQKTQPNQANSDNPLGRVLATYQGIDKSQVDIETLELRIDEAIMKEVPSLEKGHSLIKLFAGVAPLLGLLGTVVGMIATFQAITNFGTGDPKLMAGGISQALITTVLGLLSAIPLLLLHNVVNGQSKKLIHMLDEESAGLVAQAMEDQHQQKG